MNLKEEYQKIVEEQGGGTVAKSLVGGTDNRVHPRFKVKTEDLWISNVPEFAISDMSASGMAVISNHPLETGTLLKVSLGKSITLETEVVGCVMEYPPDEYTDGQFRIQCRFLEDLKGMELMVQLLRTN